MLHRGLRRRFDPLVEREAREAAPSAEGRRDLRDLPTFTIDPPTARDFDDAISAEELDDGAVRVWVHIADVVGVRAGRGRRWTARRSGARTPSTCPGLVEPMLPEALSNGACSLVPGAGPAGGHGRARVRGRARAPHRVPPLADPLGRAAVDTRGGRAVRGAASAGPAGLAAAARGWRGPWPRSARRAVRSRWSRPSPSSTSRATGTSSAAGERADRVARADRVPDDRGQRGGRGPAGEAQARPRCSACTSRRTRPRVERLLDQLASLGLPDAAGARAHDGPAGRRARGGGGAQGPRRPPTRR